MKKKWLIVLIVALVALLIGAVLIVITLKDNAANSGATGQNGGSTSTSEDISSGTEDTNKVTLTYAEYLAMTEEEQQAFRDSFEKPGDYVAWFWAAKDAYEEEQDKIILDADNPVIDFSDLVGDGDKKD